MVLQWPEKLSLPLPLGMPLMYYWNFYLANAHKWLLCKKTCLWLMLLNTYFLLLGRLLLLCSNPLLSIPLKTLLQQNKAWGIKDGLTWDASKWLSVTGLQPLFHITVIPLAQSIRIGCFWSVSRHHLIVGNLMIWLLKWRCAIRGRKPRFHIHEFRLFFSMSIFMTMRQKASHDPLRKDFAIHLLHKFASLHPYFG